MTHFNVSQADEWANKGLIAEDGWLFTRIRKFEENVIEKLDGVIYVSQFMQSEISKRLPSNHRLPNRIFPNFVDQQNLEAKVVQHKTDLICVGTLEPRKNQAYALEIVAAARSLGNPIHLTIVGDGPNMQRLRQLTRELGISDYVRFMGNVHNAASLMRVHQGYLHVAKLESFGITLIEAMATGIPVFAPKVGGISDVFSDGVEGRFIPLNDATESAKLIIEWLNSSSTMEKAGAAALDRFRLKFDSNVVAEDIYKFLQSC